MLGLSKRGTQGAELESADHESVDTISCRFAGTTAEYFEIWIVNVLVTVCSLGMYRPWANDRRREYFYKNTAVGKSALRYNGTPEKAIPMAAFVAALGVAGVVAALYQPILLAALAAIVVFAYPLMRHHALVRQSAATSYRGRALEYQGTVKDSYLCLLVLPLLSALAFFIPMGNVTRLAIAHRVEHLNYGDIPFASKLGGSEVWSALGATLGALLAVVGVIALMLMTPVPGSSTTAWTAAMAGDFGLIHAGAVVLFLVGISLPMAVWRAHADKMMFSTLRLKAGVAFHSELETSTLVGIYVSNALVILCTLGMATPWAAIRIARYRVSAVKLICYADLDQLTGDKGATIISLSSASSQANLASALSRAA